MRPGGCYLITGGLGTVGLTLAGHLAEAGAARIIVTSRNGLPADPRAAAVAALRDRGADITVARADVTDLAAMRALLSGERVDGVIHLAADADQASFRPLNDLDAAAVTRHFRAKVDGARTLAEAIAGLPAGRAPDWCLLFSSTSALLGGLTLGSYAAANAALAAQAHGPAAAPRSPDGSPDGSPAGTRWIAAAWDTWPGTLERLDGRIGAAMAAHAMTRAQALAAFDAVLAQGRRGVVVAAGGLEDRLPGRRDIVPAAAPDSPGGPAGTPAAGADRFPRPDLAQPYAPPLTATERALAEVWSVVLGVEPVGTRDNFFDLSGNSLLALRMLALVKDRFGIVIPTVTLFERPTVQALAAALDDRVAPGSPARPAIQARAIRVRAIQARRSRRRRSRRRRRPARRPRNWPSRSSSRRG